MANMSYCRFHNTNSDLIDCLTAIEYIEDRTLSSDELRCCKALFRNFIDFCCNEGIIEDENGELDDRLEEFFETFEIK